jgi:hypothetical protein
MTEADLQRWSREVAEDPQAKANRVAPSWVSRARNFEPN